MSLTITSCLFAKHRRTQDLRWIEVVRAVNCNALATRSALSAPFPVGVFTRSFRSAVLSAMRRVGLHLLSTLRNRRKAVPARSIEPFPLSVYRVLFYPRLGYRIRAWGP